MIENADEETHALLHALDNDNNSNIVKLSNSKIKSMKNNFLQQLQLSRDELKLMHMKLKEYRIVDDLSDLQVGCYLRWIPLKNPDELNLTNGAFVTDYKMYTSGIVVICRNQYNRFVQIKFDENMMFQKITDQEKIILSVIEYLNT
tara:strand:- start:39 stop:476 length:438 start_codon:yes stop_codon:yes gene_type:complete